MTAQEVVAELHVSRTTLTRLIVEGHLAPLQEYNPLLVRQPTYRFRRADIERIKSHPPDRRRGRKPRTPKG